MGIRKKPQFTQYKDPAHQHEYYRGTAVATSSKVLTVTDLPFTPKFVWVWGTTYKGTLDSVKYDSILLTADAYTMNGYNSIKGGYNYKKYTDDSPYDFAYYFTDSDTSNKITENGFTCKVHFDGSGTNYRTYQFDAWY